MRMSSFLRRLVDVPIALAAVAALAVVWWIRARRAEREQRSDAGVR